MISYGEKKNRGSQIKIQELLGTLDMDEVILSSTNKIGLNILVDFRSL